MTKKTENASRTAEPEKSAILLNEQLEKADAYLDSLYKTNPVTPDLLKTAMAQFAASLVDIPQGTACVSGCAFCCHLRVGTSIPEAIVLFNALKSCTTPEGFDFLKQRVLNTANNGNTLEEDWWHQSQTPCPFLDSEGRNQCLVYEFRPFACRAYHSTDTQACRKGFDEKKETAIPCFPLYTKFTDIYSTILIKSMAKRGMHSYQVGFVKAMQILFENKNAFKEWADGKDLFLDAKI